MACLCIQSAPSLLLTITEKTMTSSLVQVTSSLALIVWMLFRWNTSLRRGAWERGGKDWFTDSSLLQRSAEFDGNHVVAERKCRCRTTTTWRKVTRRNARHFRFQRGWARGCLPLSGLGSLWLRRQPRGQRRVGRSVDRPAAYNNLCSFLLIIIMMKQCSFYFFVVCVRMQNFIRRFNFCAPRRFTVP